ncbi:MAG: hypothetical protein HYW63_02205 [Candidatus Levybacteria bacterium]|nr:hypothetical protein [Candidatus Levybacteria bacterium]
MTERADIPQYNTVFDSRRFVALMAERRTVGFETSLVREKAYIGQQLKTDLGERLDVAKSTFVYEIRDGKLYEPGRDEPMEEVIKRGMGRNPKDRERDAAELGSFTGVIQGFLAKEDTPDGTTVLAVSPRGLPGSFEKKNFFQVYVREGEYIIGTRYFSDLTNEDYRRKIISINPAYSTLIPEKPTDVDLKSNPMVIPCHLDYSADPDKLAMFLLKKEIGMPQEQLDEVWEVVTPLVTSYTNTLIEKPGDLYWLEMNYRALLNGAHKTSERVLEQKFNYAELTLDERARTTYFAWTGTRIEIEMLAGEEIKIGGGACGSGSCSTSSESSSGVSDSPLDNLDGMGKINFRCPDCNELNTRELFNYVKSCKNCGSDKVLPPSLRGKIFQLGQMMNQ